MAEVQKKSTTIDKPPAKAKTGGVIFVGDQVRVWSEVGVTLPIGESTAHLRFSFGHERLSKSGSQAEIQKTAALVDEFNEAELDRRVVKYRRLIGRILSAEDDEVDEVRSKKNRKKSVQERAQKRLKKGKK